MLLRHLVIAIALSCGFALSGFVVSGFAQDAVEETDPAEQSEEKADPFEVPEGNDAKVLSLFLQRIARTPPAERTQDGIKSHLKKMDKAITEVLSRDIEEDLVANAATLRIQILSLLQRYGDNSAVAKTEKFVDELRHDERPAVKALARKFDLEDKVQRLPQMNEEARKELVDELVGYLDSIEEGDDAGLQSAIQSAGGAARLLERLGDSEVALDAYKRISESLKKRGDDRLESTIAGMEGTMRRLGLMGNEIEIEGTTVDGKKFNIDQYDGKVVLVDFWATWCGPCVAELPNVKAMFDAYHEKGFEVVGISLDEDIGDLKAFIEERDLEWVTLFDPNPENQGWENPIARHYGISSIPAVILVNQEGKVVNLNARGEILQEELERLLGPVPEAKGSASE